MCPLFAPGAWVPWAPAISLIQQVANLEVGECVEQGFLSANVKLATGNRPLVSLGVVVDPIDLEKASVRPVVPFCYMGDIAIFVHCVTATSVWAPTRFTEDDFGQFLVRLLGPASLRSQGWKPGNITPFEGDFRAFIDFRPLQLNFLLALFCPRWGHGGRWGAHSNGRFCGVSRDV